MRLALISDTHLNITTRGQIRAMLRKLSGEQFDLLIHAGDYSGGTVGHKSVKPTVEMMRAEFPDKPMLTVIGNHDLWCKQRTGTHTLRPRDSEFTENLLKIQEVFKQHKIHYLDTDGIYTHPDFPHIRFVGTTGWYAHSYPPTNDPAYLPIGEAGDTHTPLRRWAYQCLHKNLDELDAIYQPELDTVVFVSHFPVIPVDSDPEFYHFCWSESVGTHVQLSYKCRHFLNGHAHQNHSGPLRWECGADYMNPKFKIISI